MSDKPFSIKDLMSADNSQLNKKPESSDDYWKRVMSMPDIPLTVIEIPNTKCKGKKKYTYSELLQDRRWLEKRDHIILLDKGICKSCFEHFDNKHLQVHHKYYEAGKLPWQYPDDALITLCAECHKEVHELLNRANKVLRETFHYGLPELVSIMEQCKNINPLGLEKLSEFLKVGFPEKEEHETFKMMYGRD